jgi:hypothetical protein
MVIRSKKYTDGAKDQDCTMKIPNTCNNQNVVFCHFPDESHGIALKANDYSGGDCCGYCHMVIDRVVRNDDFEMNREWYLRRSQNRTIKRRIEQGLLIMVGLKL